MPFTIRPLSSLVFVLTVAVAMSISAPAGAGVTLMHVHGLAYSADGRQLLIPSHHGLAVFADGRWSKAAGPAHDYMGFSATRDALYSSGHPAPGSGLTNPFGLIKSRDGGKTWQKLGLEGESDFHTLATSYRTNAVYVVNHEKNSRMGGAGIYYTLADGLKWERAEARGLRTGSTVWPFIRTMPGSSPPERTRASTCPGIQPPASSHSPRDRACLP